MSVIEHSILIPTAVENVWQFISNIENNALWLADCRSIAFLTSYKQGRGARWRHTNEGGRDYVIEITNWYERVGYRYIIVNGSPYATNAGVLRLQETPEGTIVQWTFEYTLSGFLSGVRNAVSLKRGIEGNIIDSLQTLYKQVNKSKSVVPFSPKSLMQEAPDAEARAQYKPRHPSTFADKPEDDLLAEPPISDEDTKERPVVKVEAEEIQTNLALNAQEVRATLFDNHDEPSFLSGIDADTALNVGQKQSPPPPATEIPSFLDAPEKPTVEVPTLPPLSSPKEDDTFELPRLNEPTVSDSSQLSVFELFGLPKPSETQQMQAVKPVETPQPIITTPSLSVSVPTASKSTVIGVSTSRIGKRILLRRSMVNLRKP